MFNISYFKVLIQVGVEIFGFVHITTCIIYNWNMRINLSLYNEKRY
jgi:hypothetical protein